MRGFKLPSRKGNVWIGYFAKVSSFKGQETQILTPDTFARQPLTYEQIFKIRNQELSSPHSNSPSVAFEEKHFNFNAKVITCFECFEARSFQDQISSPDAVQQRFKKISYVSANLPDMFLFRTASVSTNKSNTALHYQYSDAEVQSRLETIHIYQV